MHNLLDWYLLFPQRKLGHISEYCQRSSFCEASDYSFHIYFDIPVTQIAETKLNPHAYLSNSDNDFGCVLGACYCSKHFPCFSPQSKVRVHSIVSTSLRKKSKLFKVKLLLVSRPTQGRLWCSKTYLRGRGGCPCVPSPSIPPWNKSNHVLAKLKQRPVSRVLVSY